MQPKHFKNRQCNTNPRWRYKGFGRIDQAVSKLRILDLTGGPHDVIDPILYLRLAAGGWVIGRGGNGVLLLVEVRLQELSPQHTTSQRPCVNRSKDIKKISAFSIKLRADIFLCYFGNNLSLPFSFSCATVATSVKIQ